VPLKLTESSLGHGNLNVSSNIKMNKYELNLVFIDKVASNFNAKEYVINESY